MQPRQLAEDARDRPQITKIFVRQISRGIIILLGFGSPPDGKLLVSSICASHNNLSVNGSVIAAAGTKNLFSFHFVLSLFLVLPALSINTFRLLLRILFTKWPRVQFAKRIFFSSNIMQSEKKKRKSWIHFFCAFLFLLCSSIAIFLLHCCAKNAIDFRDVSVFFRHKGVKFFAIFDGWENSL